MNRSRWALVVTVSLFVAQMCVASFAAAFATIAPPPNRPTISGLPDGRVYEQVSPANKYGYQAGARGRYVELPLAVRVFFSVARSDGNAVAYTATGPVGEENASGLSENFVATRTDHGWISRSTTARGLGQNESLALLAQWPYWRDYSSDLSHLAYSTLGPDVAGAPKLGAGNFYLMGSAPLAEPTWLLREATAPSLEEQVGTELVGMTPDASVVYIAYEGRLLPSDASRSGWGLYEYRNGKLSEVGVLPDGSVPASGAQPAATAAAAPETPYVRNIVGENNPASLDNQLSEDGTRLFFVSSGELYVHELGADGSERSVLVSASQLAGHVGEPAPDGVLLFENRTRKGIAGEPEEAREKSAPSNPTYAYASPDGSHVFFQSADQLTSAAPNGTEAKVYDFGVDTGSLEYLPNVTLGGIVTAAKDGSSFAFVNGSSSQPELDLWSAGPSGGSVRSIAQLPGGGFVGPGRLVAGDTVLVFQAQAPIPGFNDTGGDEHYLVTGNDEQVYRYDIKANELACVSCPPEGTQPSGDAYLSAVDQYGDPSTPLSLNPFKVVNDARGVSSDGSRIFFSSPDPLVAGDTNGDFDTYEWENGSVLLLSSGTSADYSLLLDNSESGSDVFFATSDGLAQGDTDAGFDVYDARIPHPGDNPPPAAVPCTGDVCQGPPSIAQLLAAPASATFNGAGNIESSAVKPKSAPKARSRAKRLAHALHRCRKRKPKQRRAACERQARSRYRAARTTVKHNNGGRGSR